MFTFQLVTIQQQHISTASPIFPTNVECPHPVYTYRLSRWQHDDSFYIIGCFKDDTGWSSVRDLTPHIPMTSLCLTCKLRRCLAFDKSSPEEQWEWLTWFARLGFSASLNLILSVLVIYHLIGLGWWSGSLGKTAILSASYLYVYHNIGRIQAISTLERGKGPNKDASLTLAILRHQTDWFYTKCLELGLPKWSWLGMPLLALVNGLIWTCWK
jgi:hypothetical protein